MQDKALQSEKMQDNSAKSRMVGNSAIEKWYFREWQIDRAKLRGCHGAFVTLGSYEDAKGLAEKTRLEPPCSLFSARVNPLPRLHLTWLTPYPKVEVDSDIS